MGIRIFLDRNLRKAQALCVLETDCRASLGLARNDRFFGSLARDGSRRPLCFPENGFSGLTENNRRSANLTCQVMRCV